MPIQTQQQLENFLLPPGTEIPSPEVKKALTELTENLAKMIREIQEKTEGITLDEFARLPQVVRIRDDLSEVKNSLCFALTQRSRGMADLSALFTK